MHINKLSDSLIRKAFISLPGCLNATIGQPNFYVPEPIKQAMCKAIIENATTYTPTQGLSILQQKIVQQYTYATDCIITSGASAALFLAFNLLKDEVIVFEPYFVSYPQLLEYLDLKPVFVSSIEELNQKITSNTSAIIINSPNNPTGYVLSMQEMTQICSIAEKHDLYIVSDEIYSAFDYSGKFQSFANMYKKTLVIDGWSKKFALTGMRIGYLAAPAKDIERVRALQQYTFVCAPHAVQVAIAQCFDTKIDSTSLAKNAAYIQKSLGKIYGLEQLNGAFYAFLRVDDEDTFVQRCIEHKLLVVKGSAFCRDKKHIRISYAMNFDDVKKMCDILIKIAQNSSADITQHKHTV